MFSFEFTLEEESLKVFEIGCFHIASQLFLVRPWKLFIEVELEEMKIIPIWVILNNFLWSCGMSNVLVL